MVWGLNLVHLVQCVVVILGSAPSLNANSHHIVQHPGFTSVLSVIANKLCSVHSPVSLGIKITSCCATNTKQAQAIMLLQANESWLEILVLD